MPHLPLTSESTDATPTSAPPDPGAALLALAKFLDREDISWCLVGDTRGFPNRIGGDVDVVIHPAAIPRLHALMSRFCREHGLRLVQMLQHEQTARYFVLAWRNARGQLHFLRVDICSDYYRNGSPLLQASRIVEGRRPALDGRGGFKGFHVAAPRMEFIYYLLKKVEKLDLQPSHGAHLSEQWKLDPDGCRSEIRAFWNEEDAPRLAQAAEGSSWECISGDLARFHRGLRQRLRFRPSAFVGECSRIIRRVAQPTGLMTVLLGPDGSGKSTVLERVQASLAPAFRRTARYHLRPMLLRHGEVRTTPVTDPHAQPPRGVVTSWAKLAFWWFDYTAGYWVSIRPRVIRSTFVLFDRYFHDLLVDPRRYRYGGGAVLAHTVARLVPHPDLWIYLDAPPAVLQSRKAEVTPQESERQRSAYLEHIRRLRPAHVVDVDRPLEDVVASVEDTILEHLEARMLQRLKHGA